MSWMQRWSALVFLTLAAMASDVAEQRVGNVGEGVHQLAVGVGQVVERYLAGCHLVLAATTHYSPLLQHVSRQFPNVMSSVMVEAESLFSQDQPAQDHLLQGLWGEARHTCRALILHLTDDTLATRFLESSGLKIWPETSVVIVGERPNMESLLQHPVLRNSKHVMYLAVYLHQTRTPNTKLKRGGTFAQVWSERVRVYRRCLYCNNGEMDVKPLHQWNLSSREQDTHGLFLDEPEDFMGYKFKISALPFFPLSAFKRKSEELGTIFIPLDSVDIRMMKSFSANANCTYEVREPWDGQWGVDRGDGNWTGIVGTLQHQHADFGLNLDLTPARIHVLDYSVLYVQERITIFSLKPGLLPQHMAIVRPFIGVVWLILLVSFIVWCVVLWLIEKTWSLMADSRSMELSYVFLYGTSVLMEEFSTTPTVSLTGRLMVGLWMLACVILTNGYRSSLAANLIVQEKMPAINSFEDLLARDTWGWGTSFANDSTMDFYRYNPSSGIQDIYKGMQYAPAEKQFERVLKGSYSHITYKNFGMGIVAASITDNRGYTPIHISRTEYLPYLGFGWGFRKGAPFLSRISMMMQHLIEAGMIEYWVEDVIATHMRRTREDTEDGEEEIENFDDIFEVPEGNVSLGFNHLQGAFYLLLLGCGLAFLTWLGEKASSCTT